MGRKRQIQINVVERDPQKYYTKNIYIVAWLKVYNIHPERILFEYDNKPLFEYSKTQRLKDTLGKMDCNPLIKKYLFCLKETLFEVSNAKQPKEDDTK